ncbi:hypothetical protein MKW92_006039 [Papaver armeniacum]|nr:hypothetical protein MKW92_006039 [Papaver armeniacum]
MSVKWFNRLKRQLVTSLVDIHISRSSFHSLSPFIICTKLYCLMTVAINVVFFSNMKNQILTASICSKVMLDHLLQLP